MNSIVRLLLLLSLLLCLNACSEQRPWVRLKDQKVTVEVVTDPESQALGLMFREHLPENHGMLFIYPSSRMLSYWMKNTKIPLDILYFDDQLKLVTIIAQAQPCRTPRCPSYPSTRPAKFVLEINGGLAKKWDVQLGDELDLHLRNK